MRKFFNEYGTLILVILAIALVFLYVAFSEYKLYGANEGLFWYWMLGGSR